MLITRRILRSIKARILPHIQERNFITDWRSLTDISLAESIFSTVSLRKNVPPERVNLSTNHRILVLAPHQDDEVIGAGGTMLLQKETGAKLSILYVTNGAGGTTYNEHGVKHSADMTAKIREEEAHKVCKRLGADYMELGIDNVSMEVLPEHVDRLREIVISVNPDVILIPWLLDGAAKHRMANHLLWLAFREESTPTFNVWGYQVNNGLWANSFVEITSVFQERQKLLNFYESQNSGLKRYDHIADGLAAWNSRILPSGLKNSEIARYVELFMILPATEHFDLVERFYLPDLHRTYSPKFNIAENMSKLDRKLKKTKGVKIKLPKS